MCPLTPLQSCRNLHTTTLTNREAWIPTGRTGNGRCKAGKCTGKREGSGRVEHPGQTIPNDRARDLDMGGKKKGKRERPRKAVEDALGPDLVKEILDAETEQELKGGSTSI